MKISLFLVAALVVVLLVAGCSGNSGNNAGNFEIAFYTPGVSSQPNCDQFGNWHAAPGHLAMTLYRVAGTAGMVPPCDFKISAGTYDPASNGYCYEIVKTIGASENPEYDFEIGTYQVIACVPGHDDVVATVWLVVE